MKAKVIKTGEIINVVPVDGRWVANFVNGVWHYTDSELDFEFADWEKFRREAAKDLMPLAAEMCDYCGDLEKFVEKAIEIADELIKQLKKEKK